MPESIRERIAVLARTNVLNVTVGNGYQHDIESVMRPLAYAKNKPAPKHLRVIQLESDAVREEELDEEDGTPWIGWSLLIAFEAYYFPEDDDATAIETRLNRWEADIQKAMMLTPQFGGLAITSTPIDSVQFEDEGGFYGRIVMMRVTYHTRENNPYTGRVP